MSVRVLVIALAVQLAVGVGFVLAAVNGFPLIGAGHRAHRATVPTARVNHFFAGRAYGLVRFQVNYGPRPAGSYNSRRLAERLRTLLPNGRFEALPGGLRNIVGYLPGRRPAVVIGAHYDTLDKPGFVGANDGAAPTAAVIELARQLPRWRRRGGPELRFVLFDGEEAPAGTPDTLLDFLRTGLRGSRAYVRAHRREVGSMILLDFIGQRDLTLPREANSNAALWARLRAAAARAGVLHAFPTRTSSGIADDHTPFLSAGIPAIDLIDFTYPPFHTTADTLDKVSAASLDVAGEATVELVRLL